MLSLYMLGTYITTDDIKRLTLYFSQEPIIG